MTLARVVARRPLSVLVLGVLLTVLAAVPAARLRLQTELAELLPSGSAAADDYRVFQAPSGPKGLELLDREEIALVIADQVMPEMSGVEFLEKVAERQPRTIRMLLTGYADMSALVRAINDGRIYRYIQKPWEPDELRLNVKRALEAWEL